MVSDPHYALMKFTGKNTIIVKAILSGTHKGTLVAVMYWLKVLLASGLSPYLTGFLLQYFQPFFLYHEDYVEPEMFHILPHVAGSEASLFLHVLVK